MYRLYPKIPLAYAEKLAMEYRCLDVSVLVNRSQVISPNAYFAPTGGNRVTEDLLEALQNEIRWCAKNYGYPEQVNDEAARNFDIDCGIICYDEMKLHPSEASSLELWAHMTCVLLPDIVRWRFPGESKTSIERFLGSDRGLRRNTFGRLWWRTYLLKASELKNPYGYLFALYEDDLVQMTERNSLAASQRLIQKFCGEYLKVTAAQSDVPRRTIIREATKRVKRLLAFINFDVLDDQTLSSLMEYIFIETVKAIRYEKAAHSHA